MRFDPRPLLIAQPKQVASHVRALASTESPSDYNLNKFIGLRI
jgi:hypothetical protein